MNFWELYAEAAKTAAGFFWKAGWAFVLGYFVSGMIQAFVPKARLTRFMGQPDVRSVSIATFFGAASSSCSFAALAATRSLVLKGAHFIAAVAFMFASTNLVIELGILILIFLSWQFLAAEIVGGLLLIIISSILIKLTYPKQWLKAARDKVEQESAEETDDFDWKKRIRSRKGWHLVGHKFAMDWKMVWEEILIGFTLAGFVSVFFPNDIWAKIFLIDIAERLPGWLVILENAMVAPLVAALTFIGSMGNIPLATVLNSNGIIFAGIMGFIYSDLMVPPLVAINAKYYGLKVALYIAAIMYVSIIITAVILHISFAMLGITPQSGQQITEVAQFKLDYTFWMNIVFMGVAILAVSLHRQHVKEHKQGKMEHGSSKLSIKRLTVYLFIAILSCGLLLYVFQTI